MLTEKLSRKRKLISSASVIVVLTVTVLISSCSYVRASVILADGGNSAGGKAVPPELISATSGDAIEIDNGSVIDIDNLDPKDPRRKSMNSMDKNTLIQRKVKNPKNN